MTASATAVEQQFTDVTTSSKTKAKLRKRFIAWFVSLGKRRRKAQKPAHHYMGATTVTAARMAPDPLTCVRSAIIRAHDRPDPKLFSKFTV